MPVRRVKIPKEDGAMHPPGISCTAEMIVQDLPRRLLEVIYEPGFCDTSRSFRPWRSCHDPLHRLIGEVMSVPINR